MPRKDTADAASKNTGFEGPEKNLEVDFVPNTGHPDGLRALSRDTWTAVLACAKCTILSSKSNAHFDAYVLSESSMFVYKWKVFIKTCGTTTLLLCIEELTKSAARLGLEVEWVGYSRKDFTFPDEQAFPHTSFSQEVAFANGRITDGSAYVLGDLTADHWYVYVADYCERPMSESKDRNLNVMMYDIDPAVAAHFFLDAHAPGAAATAAWGGLPPVSSAWGAAAGAANYWASGTPCSAPND